LELSGDTNVARSRWENVRLKGEELRKRVQLGLYDGWLAMATLALGDKDKAFAIAREMAAAVSMDAIDTTLVERVICELTLRSKDRESALNQLARLAGRPYYGVLQGTMDLSCVTYGDLKFNPLWDPLRGDPRFEKIVSSLAPKN
jgi:hypothetical protein